MTSDLHHLAAAYALDALDLDERVAFEAHHPTCDICPAELAEYQETAARMAVDKVEPDPAMRDRLLAEIDEIRQLPPLVSDTVTDIRSARSAAWRAAAGAIAVAAALIVGVVGFQLGQRDQTFDADLVAHLASPDLVIKTLTGDSGADVSIHWSAEHGRLALLATNLEALGDDMEYQLWVLDETGAVPSVVFTTHNGSASVLGEFAGTPQGWAITSEPAGGSAEPTSDVLYITG